MKTFWFRKLYFLQKVISALKNLLKQFITLKQQIIYVVVRFQHKQKKNTKDYMNGYLFFSMKKLLEDEYQFRIG